jgi:hypothetical protein
MYVLRHHKDTEDDRMRSKHIKYLFTQLKMNTNLGRKTKD